MTNSLGAVLLTSAGTKIPLYRALTEATRRIDPKAGVVAGDVDDQAPVRHLCERFWTMPRLIAGEFERLLSELRCREIRTILPTRDGELAYWAQRSDLLASLGIEVIVSSEEGLLRCLDKLEFANWAEREGLPVIPAATAPDAVRADAFVVKERFGAGSRSLGLNLSPTEALTHAQNLEQPIFQPFVAGPEISIDAWLSKAGKVHGLVLRRRDRVVSGESRVTTTFRDETLEKQARSLLERIGLRGPVVMQAIVTAAGLAVIEVNARFGGASTASIAVGLDSLYWSLAERVAPNCDLPPFIRREGEIRQVRLPHDLVIPLP